ncbi:hypothetical protein [Streptomyces sp. NBC_00102]|uniref:hypothetical protein n=1 Tax=Streptomyces sp. NBC_00102 TaxID=2975652 RepID=UPI0022520041|nr:hypothetical protein [Streptomyces sp. NBC_00102]MCX5402399.1 hypothetical protein [Streptomyces sp. NBC_00102]
MDTPPFTRVPKNPGTGAAVPATARPATPPLPGSGYPHTVTDRPLDHVDRTLPYAELVIRPPANASAGDRDPDAGTRVVALRTSLRNP